MENTPERIAELERIANGTKRVGDTYQPVIEPKKENELILDFISGMTLIKQEKVKQVLNAYISNNGILKPRYKVIEEMINQGAIIENHPKDKRRLVKPNGGYLVEKQLTKIAMDYAEFLLSKGRR